MCEAGNETGPLPRREGTLLLLKRGTRILPPAADDPLTVRLFISTVKVALAIVEAAWQEPQVLQDPRSASQLPSPGR